MTDSTLTLTLDLQDLSPEDLLTNLIDARKAMALLKAMDAALLDRLDELAEAGQIDHGGFSHNDWTVSWSAGRRSFSYPADIQALEAQLNAAKQTAQANGSATATIGASFWTFTPPRT